ncbi:MAG TPA: hypothetical protein ENK66_10465 [Arcobacter sp.]|jgi:hypothetical protein|nr:hypothetical protein [Arcobacter sp.]
MLIDLMLLILFAGVPYYLIFEKTNILSKDKIFIVSTFIVLIGMVTATTVNHIMSDLFIIIALISSLYSLYKANKTTNLYKLAYYILFFNAPMLLLFETSGSLLFGMSLIVSLIGVFLMAKYYERNYGSANYRAVTGITLVTPYAGLILTIYFTALALYPPFPNALFFLNAILNAEVDFIWYITLIIIFFGNFLIAVRVMAKTVFGKPNPNVHYIDVAPKERVLHFIIFIALVILSIIAVGELF